MLIWNQETILSYLRRYPDVMWEITRKLTGIMRQAREIIYGLAFKPVAADWLHYLFSNAQIVLEVR